ncbi:MAG: hypothetical protein CFH01_00514 [Alphaproteobacteria bacterium MarineAlpha2_Bin1]|nr:MAG: hypothetical protein CFH01_00514 [Alphaproteobacteria bacterium MarineAlpha2_Bin1]
MAMPDIGDERFIESVIFICDHNKNGAMGLVINSNKSELKFENILDELNIHQEPRRKIDIQSGGPVESARGFILHSNDYKIDTTIVITENIYLTASVDIIKDIARDKGPKMIRFTLGYTGWAAGQLEREIQENTWLHTSAEQTLVFSANIDEIWKNSVKTIGIDISHFNYTPGHA